MIDHDSCHAPSAVEADRLAELLDEIASIEAQVAALQARQVQRVAEFVEGSRRLYRSGLGWADDAQRLTAMEIAAAKRISVATAEHYMWDSIRLVEQLPSVLGVLEAGLTSLSAVRAASAEVVNLQPESLPLADEIIADDLIDALPGQARTVARARAYEIDPDAAVVAAVSAREDRFVWVSPSVAAGMANLTAIIPAEQAPPVTASCASALARLMRPVMPARSARSWSTHWSSGSRDKPTQSRYRSPSAW